MASSPQVALLRPRPSSRLSVFEVEEADSHHPQRVVEASSMSEAEVAVALYCSLMVQPKHQALFEAEAAMEFHCALPSLSY